MKMTKTLTILAVLLAFLVTFWGASHTANSQVITPTGVTTEEASQLVYWINDEELVTWLNVVNTSNTSSVTVHVQYWSNFGTGNAATDPCREDDFTDVLTPNDEHTYFAAEPIRNVDFDAGNFTPAFTLTTAPVAFITITPVVSTTDRRAIAFNNLFGSMVRGADFDPFEGSRINAMGRQARSFVDGSLLPDGTILDGISGGLVLLQPDVVKYNFVAEVEDANIVHISFRDNYSGPFGDYRSEPASTQLDPLIFNDTEVPTSCQRLTPNCVLDTGINDLISPDNESFVSDDEVICPGNTLGLGFMRMAATGFGSLSSFIGATRYDFGLGAGEGWMVAEGDTVIPSPPTPTPTAEPTATPTPDGSPTPTGGGTPNGGGGGGSGCAIAGPVQAGTAAANALIVLLPAIGFALRRRFSKRA